MTLLHDQSGRLFTHQKCSLKDILVNKEVGDSCLKCGSKLELLKNNFIILHLKQRRCFQFSFLGMGLQTK